MNNQNLDNLSSVVSRLASSTPTFWQKIKKLAVGIGVVAGVVLALPTAGVALPAVLITGAKVAAIIAGTTFANAQATTNTPPADQSNGNQAPAQ